MSALPPLGRDSQGPLRVEISSVEIHPPGRAGGRSSNGTTARRQQAQAAPNGATVARASRRNTRDDASLSTERDDGLTVAAVRTLHSPSVVETYSALGRRPSVAPLELVPTSEAFLVVERRVAGAPVATAKAGLVQPLAAALYREAAQRGRAGASPSVGSRLRAMA